jgi:hypothetical protein
MNRDALESESHWLQEKSDTPVVLDCSIIRSNEGENALNQQWKRGF